MLNAPYLNGQKMTRRVMINFFEQHFYSFIGRPQGRQYIQYHDAIMGMNNDVLIPGKMVNPVFLKNDVV